MQMLGFRRLNELDSKINEARTRLLTEEALSVRIRSCPDNQHGGEGEHQ